MTKAVMHIGTSGWSYAHWKENFYPKEVKSAEWLNYYATKFSTVEINTTFYHTPRPEGVEKWRLKVSEGFLFSVKMSRYITHIKRLKDCAENLDYFFKSISQFQMTSGPILVQLPPSFHANKERLLDFIKLLDTNYGYTFEFRHNSWYTEEYYDILREHKIALCITDLNGKMSPEVITGPFTYLRLHGPHKAYVGSYGTEKIKEMSKKYEGWLNQGISVFCYFDNDEKGYAIQDAAELQALML